MTDPQQPTPPRRRRWYQFSLRTLMIVMLLASIGMSWFAVKLQQARRQREAVKAIKAAGGWVQYDYQKYMGDGKQSGEPKPPGPQWLREILGVDFFAKPIRVSVGSKADDASLKMLAAMPDIETLVIDETRITDDGLTCLAQLPQLKGLEFGANKQITDKGLAHVARLPRLERLGFSCSKITNDGLACLAQFPSLKNFGLYNNEIAITDDGLAYIAQVRQLEDLYLWDSDITDAGLEHIARMNKLKWLDLSGSRLTAQGVAKLQEALPACGIIWP